MVEVPVAVVVAAFQDEETAGQVADAVKETKHQGQLTYKNLVVVRKDAEGKVKIKETSDVTGGVGAAIGAVVGGALGLLAGPAGPDI